MPREYLGCGNHGCLLESPKGQGTNGGCTCTKHPQTTKDRLRVEKWIWRIKREKAALEEELNELTEDL